jgi:hypothetical protein
MPRMMGEGDCGATGGMKIRTGNRSTCPSATLSTTNPTCPDPGSKPGRRGGKPATNRLSYGAAYRNVTIRMSGICLLYVKHFMTTLDGAVRVWSHVSTAPALSSLTHVFSNGVGLSLSYYIPSIGYNDQRIIQAQMQDEHQLKIRGIFSKVIPGHNYAPYHEGL